MMDKRDTTRSSGICKRMSGLMLLTAMYGSTRRDKIKKRGSEVNRSWDIRAEIICLFIRIHRFLCS